MSVARQARKRRDGWEHFRGRPPPIPHSVDATSTLRARGLGHCRAPAPLRHLFAFLSPVLLRVFSTRGAAMPFYMPALALCLQQCPLEALLWSIAGGTLLVLVVVGNYAERSATVSQAPRPLSRKR